MYNTLYCISILLCVLEKGHNAFTSISPELGASSIFLTTVIFYKYTQ